MCSAAPALAWQPTFATLSLVALLGFLGLAAACRQGQRLGGRGDWRVSAVGGACCSKQLAGHKHQAGLENSRMASLSV